MVAMAEWEDMVQWEAVTVAEDTEVATVVTEELWVAMEALLFDLVQDKLI
jgi:hypothetical protein